MYSLSTPRNVLLKARHIFFFLIFFPLTIIEWNSLGLKIRNLKRFSIFKISILKFIRPTPKSVFDYMTIIEEPNVSQESGSWFNLIRPGSRKINGRQFKMTNILKQFNALVPYFMTSSFQVLCIISAKMGPGCASLVSRRSFSSRA